MEPADPHSFICRQLADGQDGGALDLLARQWLEPGVSAMRQDAGWRHRAWIYGERLADCARRTQDPQLRARVGQLVLRVLQETLASPDRQQRLNQESSVATGEGWLDAKHLCRVLVLARPPGVVSLLAAMLADTALPVRARSHALLAYGELGGRRPANASSIVAELLAGKPDESFSDDGRIAALVRCGIVAPESLCAVLAIRSSAAWFDEIVHVLRSRADGPDAPDLARALLRSLQDVVRGPAPSEISLLTIATALHGLPRTPQLDAAAIAALREAEGKSATAADPASHANTVLRLLGTFGAFSAPELRHQLFARSSAAAYLDHPATHRHLFSGFAANTLVHTPAGTVRIDSLRAGDLVLSRAEEGGSVLPRRVARVHCIDEQILLQLELRRPGLPGSAGYLVLTGNHPLWCEDHGWYAAASLPEGARLRDTEGAQVEPGAPSHAYRTDKPHVGWFSSARSRDTSLNGMLWDFAARRPLSFDVPYDWDRWDPDGDAERDDDYARYRGQAWDLEVEETHSYFVGAEGVWVSDASLDRGFRREYAAQQVAFDAAWDAAVENHLAQRQVPPHQDIRYADGSLVAQGDAVMILQGERPGKVEGPIWAGETVVWIAVEVGQPGQATLVPVADGLVRGLRRQSTKRSWRNG